MTTPERMLVVREARWESDGMLPVSIRVLTCATMKEPYELVPLAGAPDASPSNRFCVWHGTPSSADSCCSGVMDFTVVDEAVAFVETRFPGARWLATPSRTCGDAQSAAAPGCRPAKS